MKEMSELRRRDGRGNKSESSSVSGTKEEATIKDQNHHRHPRPLVVETDHGGLVGTGVKQLLLVHTTIVPLPVAFF